MEVRTVNNIVADLLQFVIDDEYSGRRNVKCHCHPEYVHCCKQCSCKEDEKHQEGCSRDSVIDEALAYLRVEDKLAESRGEDPIQIPYR